MKIQNLFHSYASRGVLSCMAIVISFLGNSSLSNGAGILSEDTRYETFRGDALHIEDVRENSSVELSVSGNTLFNLYDGYNFAQYGSNGWLQGKIHYEITGKTVTMANLSDKVIMLELSKLDGSYSRGINVEPGESTVVKVSDEEKFRMVQANFSRGWNDSRENIDMFDKSVVIVEGSYPDENISYFEGFKSAGEGSNYIDIVSKNQNLDRGVEHRGGYYLYTNGVYYTNPEVNSHIAIVEPNKTYALTSVHSNATLWDANFNYIKGYAADRIITTPVNCKYIRYAVPTANENLVRVEEVGLNAVSQKKEKSIRVNLSEPLRGLPSGSADRIVRINDEWYVERNIKKIVLNGNENWGVNLNLSANGYAHFLVENIVSDKKGGRFNFLNNRLPVVFGVDESVKQMYRDAIFLEEDYAPNHMKGTINISINKNLIGGSANFSTDNFKNYLSNNPITMYYQTNSPTYELLNINMNCDLYQGESYIFNTSQVPIRMEVTVDRVLNRAMDSSDLAERTNRIEDISQARYWINLLSETIKKDELQNKIDNIYGFDEFNPIKKTNTVVSDVYIVPKNVISMSLDTNIIVFDNVNISENKEIKNAVKIHVKSSLPYELTAELSSPIVGGVNRSEELHSDVLSIKESVSNDYMPFLRVGEKISLIDNSEYNINTIHSIDMRLETDRINKIETYETSIKFEVIQK